MTLHLETATAIRQAIQDGEITSEEIVRGCLGQITATEDTVKAWIYLDPDGAIKQAQELDALRQSGRMYGTLHGIPIGLKDIFDVAGMPCELGSQVHIGRMPEVDCTVTSKLKEAGAVIMGKTVTTEFALRTPGKTTNPHNESHTPGGSSSGSAAAVAAGQVPVAIGSQTNGSVIRPASFCGVFGVKPSFGMISRSGVLETSKTLDHVGVFGRSLEDVALVSDAITGYDIQDSATYARPKPRLLDGCNLKDHNKPGFAFLNLPYSDRISDETRNGFKELNEVLGIQITEIDLPKQCEPYIAHHRIIHEYELLDGLKADYERCPEKFSPQITEVLERAKTYSEDQYTESLGVRDIAQRYFEEFFYEFDAILTPAATGIAPEGLTFTGDTICNTIWTFAGLPCLTLPLLSGESEMPIGVQLVGPLEGDASLCHSAQWLLGHVNDIAGVA